MLSGHSAQMINEKMLRKARFSVYYRFNTWYNISLCCTFSIVNKAIKISVLAQAFEIKSSCRISVISGGVSATNFRRSYLKHGGRLAMFQAAVCGILFY
jgi:hypothetical protein